MSNHFELFWKGGSISLHRCRVMGILNLTPDSFFDGGRYNSLDSAIERAWDVVDEGGDILDVGAESSRPGSDPITVDEEKRRIFPILEKLKTENYPLPISLDTTKPELVKSAYASGLIQIANDIGGLRDPNMVRVVLETKIPIVIMHMVGTPKTMQQEYFYENVAQEILEFFQERLDDTGLRSNVVLDPGLGFGKSVAHNLTLLNRLSHFSSLGLPLMIGASRKSFIGTTLDLDLGERLEGSLACAAIAVDRGAKIIRVHDVAQTVRVVRMVEGIVKTPVGDISAP